MENDIQSIINKYEKIPLKSLKIENNILDIEKNNIFEEESQIPELVKRSNYPFDKNICFYENPLTLSIHENIFPKQKYFLKSQQIIELKPLDINKIFNDDNLFENKVESQNKDKNEIKEDDNSVHNKIISTIESHHYKNYYPKNKDNIKNEMGNINSLNKYLNTNEMDNEWYIVGENNEGPFNDLTMYNKLYKLYYARDSKFEKYQNYLINDKKSDIFMTMEDCFNILKSKFEKKKNNNNIYYKNNQYANQFMFQYMNNMILQRNQLLQNYYQFIKNNQNNNLNIPNNLKNKNKSPNKFDIPSQNKTLNNNNIQINNENKDDENNNGKFYDKNTIYNYNNKGNKNIYHYNNNKNTVYYKNDYIRKEKNSEYNQYKKNNFIKNEIELEENNSPDEKENEKKKLIIIDPDEFFKKE